MPIVKTWRNTDPMPAGSLNELPKRAGLSPLTAEDYFEIVMRQIAARRTIDAKPNDEAALRLICRLHAELQARKLEVPPSQRSLNHLWDAVSLTLAVSYRIRTAPNTVKGFDQFDEILAHYETSFPGSYVARLVYALRGDSGGGST